MSGEHLTGLGVLHCYPNMLDEIDLTKAGNEFISAKPNRMKRFGEFTEDDFKHSIVRVRTII